MAGTNPLRFTETQRQLIEAPSGKRILLGGPGSGKSTIVAERAIFLVSTGMAHPDQVLVLAPSRRAALALEDHIRQGVERSLTPIATSFHGLARTILQYNFRQAGYKTFPRLLDTASHFNILRQMLIEEDPALWPCYHAPLGTKTLERKAYDVLMGAAENLLSESEAVDLAQFWGQTELKELAQFRVRYQDHMRQAGLIDFGQLLACVASLLSTSPEVTASFQKVYRHILVDEFEDANFAQAEILRSLNGENTDLLVVGEPHQAINSYRGGSAYNLLDSANTFQATVQVSPDSFRLSQHLSSFVNHARPETSNTPDILPEGSHPKDNHSAGRVLLHTFSYPAEEIHWIGGEIQSLLREGGSPDRIAILFRSLTGTLPRRLSAELARRGIKCDIESGQLVLQTPLVRAAVDLLRYLANPAEGSRSFGQFLHTPLAGLPPFGFQNLMRAISMASFKLEQFAAEERSLDALTIDEDLRAATASLLDRISSLEPLAGRSPAALLWEIWRLFPAFHEDAKSDGPDSAAYSLLLTKATDLQEQRPSFGVQELLELIDEGYFQGLRTSAKRGRNVTITTVHQAKGREWDAVFLPCLVEGAFPQRLSSLDATRYFVARDSARSPLLLPEDRSEHLMSSRLADHFAEEARVFYVGASRARRDVYLTYSNHSTDGSSTEQPSRLLDSIADCPVVEIVSNGEIETLPTDLSDVVTHYRRQLRSTDTEEQALALYALSELRKQWPESVQAKDWWSNIAETTGAAEPFPDGRLYLSASRLGNFRNCPLGYQYGYHWRLGEPEGVALTIGSLLHAVLEQYHKPDSTLPRARQSLETVLDSKFDESAFPYRPIAQQARKTLSELLDKYYGRYGLLDSVTAVEQALRFSFGPHTISGFIDRIDLLAPGELELIDYKTGGQMSKNDAENDLQLAVYALAFSASAELRSLGKPIMASYLYPKSIGPKADGKRSYVPTEASSERLVKRLNYFASAILGERFPSRFSVPEEFPDLDALDKQHAKEKDACRICSFSWICPEKDRGSE